VLYLRLEEKNSKSEVVFAVCRLPLTSCLRGPAPKKRPMISGQKIKSADFYLPSRGYRILFKNEFFLFQFRFKPKTLSRKLFPSDSSKVRPKISLRKKLLRNYYRKAK